MPLCVQGLFAKHVRNDTPLDNHKNWQVKGLQKSPVTAACRADCFLVFPDVRKIALAGKLGNPEPIEGHYLTENAQPLSKKSAGNHNNNKLKRSK
jgi:hypothetical protein